MKILITGSEGLVGRELAKTLERRGHLVRRFDAKLGNNILDAKALASAVKGADAVYHLAAQLDEGAKDLFRVNVAGTKNVLEACAKERVAQLVYLSTVGVMGDLKRGVRAGEKTPQKPLTRYEKSKAEAEKIVLTYLEVLPVTIVRSAMVLGPNEFWAGIIKQAKHNFPLVGDGKNKWQVIYYRDLADALVFLLGEEDAMGEIFIVAEEGGMTLKQFYEALRAELGVSAEMNTIGPIMAKAASWFFFTKAIITKHNTIVLPAHIDRLVRERSYNTGKMEGLGWHALTPTKQAIAETVKAIEIGGKK
ncbi:MAG: NAD-dependent epimerase/dehydratase family protein [Candidatus Diapherotrites archaeon]